MAIGERDPARARVEAALDVGWWLGTAYGMEAGYRLARDEINEEWRTEAAIRVFVAGTLMDRPTASERRAEREQILREGHAAGFHAIRPAHGCPVCQG